MVPHLIPPFLVTALGTVIGILWVATRRQSPFLFYTAAGFYLIALALGVHLFVLPYDERIATVASMTIYGCGAGLLAYALIRRSQLSGGVITLALLCSAITIGTIWFSLFSESYEGRTFAVNLGLAAILLFGAWRTRQLASGTTGDKLLFWWFLIVGVHYIPRSYLMATNPPDTDVMSDGTFLWVLQLFPLAGLILLFGVVTIIATGLDIIVSIQDERDTDPLTGVRNRRGLERLLRTTKWSGKAVSILICDIDRFKQINDRYGHHGGDLVLEHFGRTLVSNVRESDIVVRLGGEEFVVIMPGTELAAGVAIAERIRSLTPAMRSDTIAPGLVVQCSIGVTQLRDGEDIWSAIRRADELLYQAKQMGRNRVVSEQSGESSNLIKFPESTLKKA